MSTFGFATPRPRRQVRGAIRRRLLVNAVVDPEEAARLLPVGLRPHQTEVGTVVGCCLLDLCEVRPAGLRAGIGINLRAAAHRISVEWDEPDGNTAVGVYVPVRHTDSRLAVLLGGRWFPGVHQPATVEIDATAHRLSWRVAPTDTGSGLSIRVDAVLTHDEAPTVPCDPVGLVCVDAAVGVSPRRSGVLEATRMIPDSGVARQVDIEDLESGFLAGFASATPAPSYLMSDVGVTWAPTVAPAHAYAGSDA